MSPRKSPKRTYAKALEAMVSLYENDKNIAEFFSSKESEDWAKSYLALTNDPDLGELVMKLFIHEPDSRCLIWGGNFDAGGYPRVQAFGRLRPVQRVAWQLFNRSTLHPSIIIRMTCGDKRCISLGHMGFESKARPLAQARAKRAADDEREAAKKSNE